MLSVRTAKWRGYQAARLAVLFASDVSTRFPETETCTFARFVAFTTNDSLAVFCDRSVLTEQLVCLPLCEHL